MSGGEMSEGKFPRHPWDWYVEPDWTVDVLLAQLEKHCTFHPFFDPICHGMGEAAHLIMDPACGHGTIPDFFGSQKYPVIACDIADRRTHRDTIWMQNLVTRDFLEGEPRSLSQSLPVSIVCNPPYSWQNGQLVRGLAQRFVERALQVANRKVCMLLPLKWLAGEARGDFLNAHPPRFIFVLNRRPSMPPGDMIAELGAKAFKRGRIDYCWVVWDHAVETLPGETKTIFVTADECQGEAM